MKTKNIQFSLSLILILVFACSMGIQAQSSLPSDWTYQTNTSNPHGIIVMLEANPRINNIPIEVGDYIGAFYTDDNGELGCGGADFWLGDENIIFPIFGDDPDTPEKDGFSYYEQIYFKIFSVNNQKSYDVDQIGWSSDYSSTNHWSPLALSAMIDVVSYVDFDAFISSSSNPVCVDKPITLSANIFVGTTGSYTYSWTSEPEGLFSSASEIFLTPEVNTRYFLEVSDGVLNSSHALSVSLQEMPTIDAGSDISICPENFAQIQAQGQNFSDVLWSTGGDGSFFNADGTSPKYYPGSIDIETGVAHIVCTAAPMPGCSVSASDSMDVIIIATPVISLPAQMEFCTAQDIWLQAEAANYSSIFWNTTGDGTFSDTNALSPQYFPGAQDLSNGATSLHLCARPLIPTADVVCSTLGLTLVKAPTVNAPASLMRCDNQPITLNTIAKNYAQIQWLTYGDGTFSNLHTTSTKYYPGVEDKLTQAVQVSISALGYEACTAFPASRSIQLILGSTATVEAGSDRILCQGQNLTLDAEVENYSAVVWSSTGDGFFTNSYIPNPVYYPGAGDIANGSFSMVLTVYPIYPCITTIIDGLDVEIVNTPEVEILTDDNQVFPAGQAVNLQAEAGGFQSLLWESSGDGTFDDPVSLNPIYIPGTLVDAIGDPIVLSLTAFASPGCGSDASDQISVSFSSMAVVDAGEDATFCEDTVSLSGSNQLCTSLVWQTDGDGTFDDTTSEITNYYPGVEDIQNALVELCLTGYDGESPVASDCIEITIVPNAQLSMGVEQVDANYGEVVPLVPAVAENLEAVLWFTTNGGGDFTTTGISSVIYNPSPAVDYVQGCIEIYMVAEPLSPCLLASEDDFEICFVGNPTVDAGDDATLCEDAISLSASSEYVTTVLWQTDGDGTFDDPASEITNYYPGASDIQNALVELCLTGYDGESPVASDCIEITIVPNAQLSMGVEQVDANYGEVVPLVPAVAENLEAVLWFTTNGGGDFTTTGISSVIYNPSPAVDYVQGCIEIYMVAEPLSPCLLASEDDFEICFFGNPTVDAGDDATLCEDAINLSASSEYCTAILWQTDGDGTFDDPTSEVTNYYPGVEDIQNALVELCLTGYDGESPVASDCIEITIVPNAQLSMGVEQVDANYGEVVPLVPAVAENLEAVLWFTTNGGGDFTTTGISSVIYNPSPAVDYVQGCIEIYMVAEPLSPCLLASEDDFEICFFGNPTVDAGDDATLCEDAINLSASSDYCTSVLWQTDGDGTFDDPTSEITNYYPGVEDIQNAQVELCLTGYDGESPVASDCIEITIVPNAQLSMGVEQVDANYGEVVPLVPAVAENLEAVLWFTTNGGGDFTPTGISSVIYNPSPAVDYVQGCIEIYMVAEPLSPCLLASEDDFEICFFGNPTVDAGDDATLCEDAINLSASSDYCTSVLWQTDGDGTFDDPASEITNYHPGTLDIQNALVELCLTGYDGESPVVSDCIEITIVPAAQFSMGVEQVSACYGEVVPLDPAVAENLEAVLWFTTNGGGDFTPTGISSVIYTPAPAVDYVQGCIEIYMVAEPLSPCLQASEDDFEICFFGNPTVDAGNDKTIVEDESCLLNPQLSDPGILAWTTTGDGTFDDPASVNPEYFPGSDDISNGQVDLNLLVYPVAPCAIPATDQMHLTIFSMQTLFIPEGWSGISSYLQIDNSIVDVFSPISDLLIIAQTNTGIYWPDGGLNTIGDFTNKTGYKLRMSEEAELTLIGSMEDDKVLELSQGWTLMPILSKYPIHYSDLLNQMGDHLIVAKDLTGNGIVWPDYNIYTLQYLYPGKTYLVAIDQDLTFSFEDLGGDKSAEMTRTSMSYSPWTIQEKTSITHNVAIQSSALQCANPGDFIGAFSQKGDCVGFSEILDKTQNLAITIFGDEAISEEVIEGMSRSEQIQFRLYSQKEQLEYALEVVFDTDYRHADGSFAENGLSAINAMQKKTTLINESDTSVFSIYPNPAKGIVNFVSDNQGASCHLTIQTINGLLMMEKDFTENLQLNFSDWPRGIYMLRMQNDKGSSFHKLILE